VNESFQTIAINLVLLCIVSLRLRLPLFLHQPRTY